MIYFAPLPLVLLVRPVVEPAEAVLLEQSPGSCECFNGVFSGLADCSVELGAENAVLVGSQKFLGFVAEGKDFCKGLSDDAQVRYGWGGVGLGGHTTPGPGGYKKQMLHILMMSKGFGGPLQKKENPRRMVLGL